MTLNRAKAICVLFVLCSVFPAQAQISQSGTLIPATALGTAVPLEKPTLVASGGTLILSDSPEEISAAHAVPAAMYRDTAQGVFRVFYHHQNTTNSALNIGVALTNNSNTPELLFAHGSGQGVDNYPAQAGQIAFSDFLSSHHSTRFLTLLMPGQSYYSVQTVPSGDTASGFLEYLAVSIPGKQPSGELPPALLLALDDRAIYGKSSSELASALPSGFGIGSTTVTTLIYSGVRPEVPQALPILAGDDHIRGTFAHFNRKGTLSIAASAGLQGLAIDTAAPGLPWSDDMPGEYELGTDVVDSNARVYNDGNYGVLYEFQTQIQNGQALAQSPVGLLMQPTGGAGLFVMSVNRHVFLSPYVDYTSAWWFDELKSGSKAAKLTIETSLTGGSAGPQFLLFAPKFNGQ